MNRQLLMQDKLPTTMCHGHVGGVFADNASTSGTAACVVQPSGYICWPVGQTTAENLQSDLPGIFWRGCIWSLPPLWNIPWASCSWPRTGQTYLWQDKRLWKTCLWQHLGLCSISRCKDRPRLHVCTMQNIKNGHVFHQKSHVLHYKTSIQILWDYHKL